MFDAVDCGGAVNACGDHNRPLDATVDGASLHTYICIYINIVFVVQAAHLLPCLLILFDIFLSVLSFFTFYLLAFDLLAC